MANDRDARFVRWPFANGSVLIESVREDVGVLHVAVDGDVTLDWYVSTGHGHDGVLVHRRPGGAALLTEIVGHVIRRGSPGDQWSGPLAYGDINVDDPTLDHSWSTWSRDRATGGWWIERTLGVTRASATNRLSPRGMEGRPHIVVLDDAALGYRDDPERWPAAIAAENTTTRIVLRMGEPLLRGRLWERLYHHRGRLVVIVDVDDLRRSQVQVSRGVSWERTAQDLAWELTHNLELRPLFMSAHVVVTFGAAGAMIVTRDAHGENTTLLFDPMMMEGEWERDRPGPVVGIAQTLSAYVVLGIIDDLTGAVVAHSALANRVSSGLGAVRALLDGGFELDADGGPAFPFKRVADAASDLASPAMARVTVRQPQVTSEAGYWTILEARYQGELDDVSTRVATYGPATVLRHTPQGRFGHFLTVDRREIESLRAIRSLIEEYCNLDHADRPLSIAVFGPPGSGKSFGVTQVASSVLPGRLQKVEFNLSQFASPDAIVDALHQVRDISLKGHIPLVFWDEFDTALDGIPLGWLRYFLAPMQDGAFREGQIVHPIGRAIFVFAGGTAASMEKFFERAVTVVDENVRRAAKQPDFVSRLRGYLDVLGPNSQGSDDRFARLRRAILFESLLRRKAPQFLHKDDDGDDVLLVDAGVVRAFLDVPLYRHGARSMEAVIDMSRLRGHRSFERSCLPSEAQLDLHVDGRRFLSLVHRLELSGYLLEQLAEAAHDILRADLEHLGYRYGPTVDEARKLSPKICAFGELDEADKEQNRANVRDIPNKLAAVGYVMVAARSEEATVSFPPDALELLARNEHDRWMAAKRANGWTYGERTDEAAKRHDALVPWDDLPDDQRKKDRTLVAGIAAILGRCGYAVMPAPG